MQNGISQSAKAFGADKSKQFVLKAAAKYGFMGRYNKSSIFHHLNVSSWEMQVLPMETSFWVMISLHTGDTRFMKILIQKSILISRMRNTFFTMFNKYTWSCDIPFATNPSSTIYGMAFFEAANGWYDYKDYNPFRLRRSAGVGYEILPANVWSCLDLTMVSDSTGLKPTGGLKDASRFTFMLGL